MRNVLKTIVYIFFPPYLIVYILKYLDVINIITELSVFLAIFLNIINLSIALLLYNFSKSKSNQLFLILNIGGMGVRIFFLLITFTLSLIFLEIDKYAFILVFLIFYSMSIVFEIKHFNSKKD
ncbi:MAG: hypothetical protein DRI84_04595 [Bacteroidetes bacterium]|nr:MAG: hypothetical protein DRI84_04595 [Bacteroidota bacterium]